LHTKRNLWQRSIDIILANQSPAGSFPASPEFPTYRYAWLRDGTFTAYALDLAGRHRAAARFYHWVNDVMGFHCGKAWRLLESKQRGECPGPDGFLHTRYQLCGQEGVEPWGNFQLDGYGIYLWGLERHRAMTGDEVWKDSWDALELVASYLTAFWDARCLDCWEENDSHLHPSTLACIYGGLVAYLEGYRQQGLPCPQEAVVQGVLARLPAVVERDFYQNGHFTKHPGRAAVDANLLWLAVPFRLFDPADSRMTATVAQIERDLVTPDGGVKRYAHDTYYGGGPWVLLTSWLGWYYTQVGNCRRAEELLAWVEGQADPQGNLPEQVPVHMNAPDHYPVWVERWGPIASPLLWSHAMYLVVVDALDGIGQNHCK